MAVVSVLHQRFSLWPLGVNGGCLLVVLAAFAVLEREEQIDALLKNLKEQHAKTA